MKIIILILLFLILISFVFNIYYINKKQVDKFNNFLSDSDYLNQLKQKEYIGNDKIIITNEEIYLPDLGVGYNING